MHTQGCNSDHFRPRTGFQQVAKVPTGRVSRQHGAKQRFDVYVCTAAERGYALEAWRILDPKVSYSAVPIAIDTLTCLYKLSGRDGVQSIHDNS